MIVKIFEKLYTTSYKLLHGKVSLNFALKNHKYDLAKLLIEHGAQIDVKDTENYTPLHYAITNNQYEIIRSLIKDGANIDALNNTDIYYLLLFVADYNNQLSDPFITKYRVDIKDAQDHTLLYYATCNHNYTLATILIEKGADIHATDIQTSCLLQYAVEHPESELIDLLINKYDVNVKDEDDHTLLYYAIRWTNYTLATTLIKKGADIHAKDIKTSRLLRYAIEHPESGLIDHFITTYGVDVKDKSDGDSLLFYATHYEKYDLVKTLITEKNADVNIQNTYGQTPLCQALFKNNYELAKLLLENGAGIHIKNSHQVEVVQHFAKMSKHHMQELLKQYDTNN